MPLAEDQQEVVLLQLYHQEQEQLRKATDVFSVSDIYLIKEPFLKTMASGGYGLRVDHLSDIVRIAEDSDVLPLKWRPRLLEIDPSAEATKQQGDKAVREGNFRKAIE